MNLSRREFLRESMAALGFLALPGGMFAAPAGWKPTKRPNLVFGILSDTHLQSGWDGVKPHGGFPLTYVANAMRLFRDRNVDAFMHLGDMAHRGKTVEAQYHRDLFEKFFPGGKRPSDGRTVEKLLVVGNHEWYGDVAGGPGAWAPNIWKDKAVRDRHTLCGDMPGHWEQVWGEKYEDSWHKEVNGYHFFGRHWTTDEAAFAQFVKARAGALSLKGDRPFFILSHKRNHFACCNALRDYPNAIAFCGHWHMSNADWKTIFCDNFGFTTFPTIQVGACRMDGGNCLDGKERLAKGALVEEKDDPNAAKTAWSVGRYPSRQAMIVNVYDDMVVFERHEVGEGGKLGPDWVFPVGNFDQRPYSRDSLVKMVGKPEFPPRAKLVVAKALFETPNEKADKKPLKEPGVRIDIPMADGNPASRPYAYEVVVVGDDRKARLFKSVFFRGVNCGMGHEPDFGVTRMTIPVSELPAGRKLTIAVRPVSSLGTKGKTIGVTWNAG